jgi:CheY-like chemotaxis protein
MGQELADTYVLVVDDDPDALALMSALVASMGIGVKVARDGHEALERIRENTPGFVVLDLMMPRMDGFGVLSRLQLDPKTRDIPILILTAARLSEGDVLDLRGTVLGVVRKGDLDLDDISRVIEETLKARKPTDSSKPDSSRKSVG